MAEELVLQLGFKDRTKISYGTTAGGWPGDVPHSRMDGLQNPQGGFILPRTSDEAVRLAISRIIEWLPQRKNAEDDLRLPRRMRSQANYNRKKKRAKTRTNG